MPTARSEVTAAALSGFAGAQRVAGPVGGAEAWLARRAGAIAIVAEGFRDYFLEGGVSPARIHRVRNPARLGPALESRESVRARLGWAPDEFVALHSGSMGAKQRLETVIDAAALARRTPGIRFVLQGDGSQRPRLVERARTLGLHNVDFLPLARSEEFPSVLAAADSLLLCQRGSVCNMSMPAKLASYFAAGVPVVASVAHEDETAREVEAAAAGLVVEPDRPDLLLDALQRLRHSPAAAAALGAAGREFAERHLNERAALESMARFVNAAAARGRQPISKGEHG
jgi:glycosyltransferase involved in cell wall biosynthesis